MGKGQNFFNIGTLTDQFEKAVRDLSDAEAKSLSLSVFQVMAGLAIAQQLSVIATTLRRLEKTFQAVPEVESKGEFMDSSEW